MIARTLEDIILEKTGTGKAIIILGPRQVGKSTLLRILESKMGHKILSLNCDNSDIRKLLSDSDVTTLRRLTLGYATVLIDEAQRVANIGMTLKLITDQLPDLQLIVTGSSSLDLANLINEPLTGRKFEYQLFPLSMKELADDRGFVEAKRDLGQRLIYGSYPDVVNNPGNEPEILNNLVSSYLYKDVFVFQDIRKPEFIDQLLEALALQLASEVSYHELASTLRTDSKTVQRYISLLEKAYVVFRLRSLSRNARHELKKSRKIYFYDNGVRNAILGNYAPVGARTDFGALWENFFIAERMKYLHYNKIYAKRYFWRTTQQQEIDYLEEADGQLQAFEIKWDPTRKFKFPSTFSNHYPQASLNLVHSENFWEFLGL